MIGGLSSITPMHQRGTKGLMWGARGSFPPAVAMVVMVAVGSWLLGHVSTVGIVFVFYGINLFFGKTNHASVKSICPVRPGRIKFILFVNTTCILGLFWHKSGIHYTNFGSHPLCRNIKFTMLFLKDPKIPKLCFWQPKCHFYFGSQNHFWQLAHGNS